MTKKWDKWSNNEKSSEQHHASSRPPFFYEKRSSGRRRISSGAGLLANGTSARAQQRGRLNPGDAAILRFLAAAELIEADLWTQYAELGGIGNNLPIEVAPNQTMNTYQMALSNLDSDGPQYIASNTLDEASHAAFLNAYLESRGAEPVNLDRFRTLQGSTATGIIGHQTPHQSHET